MAYSCGRSFKPSSFLLAPRGCRDSPRPLLVLFASHLGNRRASYMLKRADILALGVRVFSSSMATTLPFKGFSISTSTMWQAAVVHCWKKSFGKNSCKETGMRGSYSIGSPTYVCLVALKLLLGFLLLRRRCFLPCSTFGHVACGLGFLIFL